MTIQRRRLLQLTVAAAAMPNIVACDGGDLVLSADTRFPMGPFNAK